MRAIRRFNIVVLLSAGVVLAAIFYASERIQYGLGKAAVFSGWILFAAMVGLSVLNWRKKLSMLPLGRAAYWLGLHVVGGVFAVALFWIHTNSVWPLGRYEQALAVLFYLVSLSGLAGYLLQRIYPLRLTETGVEYIYERIPGELARIREDVEKTLLACTEETGSDTLARHYVETMAWFFGRPRFFWNHAVSGEQGRKFVEHELAVVSRYVNAAEQKHLDHILALAREKVLIDRHYAMQSIMKRWLLLHIPLAVGVMSLVLWHVVLVHVYLI